MWSLSAKLVQEHFQNVILKQYQGRVDDSFGKFLKI